MGRSRLVLLRPAHLRSIQAKEDEEERSESGEVRVMLGRWREGTRNTEKRECRKGQRQCGIVLTTCDGRLGMRGRWRGRTLPRLALARIVYFIVPTSDQPEPNIQSTPSRSSYRMDTRCAPRAPPGHAAQDEPLPERPAPIRSVGGACEWQ
jgi:hypothetical protein